MFSYMASCLYLVLYGYHYVLYVLGVLPPIKGDPVGGVGAVVFFIMLPAATVFLVYISSRFSLVVMDDVYCPLSEIIFLGLSLFSSLTFIRAFFTKEFFL